MKSWVTLAQHPYKHLMTHRLRVFLTVPSIRLLQKFSRVRMCVRDRQTEVITLSIFSNHLELNGPSVLHTSVSMTFCYHLVELNFIV